MKRQRKGDKPDQLVLVLMKINHYLNKAFKPFVCIVTFVLILFAAAVVNHRLELNKEFLKYQQKYSWLTKEVFLKVKDKTKEKDIPLPWMLAIYHSESRGNRYAVSKSGALGLGQVMPEIHLIGKYKGIRADALYDLDFNIELSTSIFKNCLDMNKGDLIKALNCYERGNKRQDVNVNYLSEIITNIGVLKELENER